MKILNHTETQQLKIKSYYDQIKPKTILETDLTDKKFQEYQKLTSQTPITTPLIYEMFYTIYNTTTLKDMSIPAEAFAQEYRIYKSFELEEEEHKQKTKKAEEDIEEE
jgi:hypothetical protein